MEAYAKILPYLLTLDNPEDICMSILTFYSVVNYWLALNGTTPESFIYPLANPYNMPSEFVSTERY